MRNGIPGVLIEVYSASVSLLVAIGTCCGAGAAQVQSNIALGHLSPMLYNNKGKFLNGYDSQSRTICPMQTCRLLRFATSNTPPVPLEILAGLWFPRTPELRCTLRDCGPPIVPHKTSGPNPGPQFTTDIDTLSIHETAAT
ncbi:hypothetical protein ACLKA7_000755 [Drosophila subpalustris]